jgi:hypothetical protein
MVERRLNHSPALLPANPCPQWPTHGIEGHPARLTPYPLAYRGALSNPVCQLPLASA